jgi:hypothetical protein
MLGSQRLAHVTPSPLPLPAVLITQQTHLAASVHQARTPLLRFRHPQHMSQMLPPAMQGPVSAAAEVVHALQVVVQGCRGIQVLQKYFRGPWWQYPLQYGPHFTQHSHQVELHSEQRWSLHSQHSTR